MEFYMNKLQEFLRSKYLNLSHDFDLADGWNGCKKEVIKIIENQKIFDVRCIDIHKEIIDKIKEL